MRIAIIRSYPLSGSNYYNIQELGLGYALSRSNDVMVLLPKPNGEIATHGTIQVKCLPTISLGGSQLILKGLYKALRDFAPDEVIVGGDLQFNAVLTTLACKVLRMRVWLYQGTFRSENLFSEIRYFMIDLLIRSRIQGVLAKSFMAEQFMRQRRYKNITVVGVGLDERAILPGEGFKQSTTETRTSLGISLDQNVLLHVGELSERRNAELTLSILNYIVDHNANYVAVVVGDGALRNDPRFKHRNIRFLGKVPQSELWKYYRASDALINPWQYEIFGMACLEAIYFGCKVFGFEQAPGPHYLHSKYPSQVYLVPNLQSETWYRRVQAVFSEEVPKAPKSTVTWEHVHQMYIQVFDNLSRS